LWTNLSYRHAKIDKDENGDIIKAIPCNFEFVALTRIIKNNDDFINKYTPTDTSFKTGTIFDLGIKAAYDYKNFTIDLEYIHRFNRNKIIKIIDGYEYSRTENFDTHKFLLSINYNISDNLALSYNIGQGFDSAFNDGGNLISGLSLNFGFGNIKAEDLMRKKQNNTE
jgi:hypothetical protein